jgi:hypothetical protein
MGSRSNTTSLMFILLGVLCIASMLTEMPSTTLSAMAFPVLNAEINSLAAVGVLCCFTGLLLGVNGMLGPQKEASS